METEAKFEFRDRAVDELLRLNEVCEVCAVHFSMGFANGWRLAFAACDEISDKSDETNGEKTCL